MRSLIIALAIVVMTTAGPALAQGTKNASKVPSKIDLKGKSVEQTLTDLIPGMGEKEPPARFPAQQQWQAICIDAGAPGNEARRLEVCQAMAAKLGSNTPEQARLWMLKQLEFIGRAECVAAVAKAIDDSSELVRESAVRSLANNPAEEATAALLSKLPSTKGATRVAVIHALGYRKAADAVSPLANELKNSDPVVAQAVARALGRIANPEAAVQLKQARQSAKDRVRLWISDAYLLCADRLLKEGKTKEAAAIYEELQAADGSRPIRLAALKGSLRAAGANAGDRVFEFLKGTDDDARDIALAEVVSLQGDSVNGLVTRAGQLPPQTQVLLLLALSTRNEKTNAYITKAANSDNEAIQKAAIQALGRLGDAGTVGMLAERALSKDKNAGAARDSLSQLVAPGVDEKLIALLKAEKSPANRVGLIAILEARRSASAVPALLDEARGDSAETRAASMQALSKIADPKDLSALVAGVLKAAKGAERDAAERALVAVAIRIPEPEKRVEPVLAVVTSGNKVDLLPLVGRIGGPKALTLAKEHLNSNSPEEKTAAIVALTNWPDYSVSEDLIVLAKSAPTPELKALAFRNLVRVNSLDKDQPAKPRLDSLKEAMKLASTPADKKQVLDGLATVKDIETLRMVVPLLDDPALKQSACKTVVELAHSKMLREPNRAEFHAALDRVMAICDDKGLIERAKKYKAGG